MSRPEAMASGPLARRDGEPVFDEPWQAQALGLALNLVARGEIEAGEWSAALGAELERASARGDPDDPRTYYRSVLAAHGRVDATGLAARVDAWRRAYLATPHGQPVELSAGDP